MRLTTRSNTGFIPETRRATRTEPGHWESKQTDTIGGALGAVEIFDPATDVMGSLCLPFADVEGSDGGENIRNAPDAESAYAKFAEDGDVDDGAYPAERTSVSSGMDAINAPSGAASSSSES